MSERKRTLLEQLEAEVDIPETVRRKADRAFDQIRRGQVTRRADRKRLSENTETYPMVWGRRKRRTGRRIAIAAAAAVLTLGAVSVGAAVYLRWSKSLSEGLQVTDEQKQVLETTGMAVVYEDETLSVTDQGITVSLEQSMADNYFAYLIFRVEGYEVEPEQQPGFERCEVLLDGSDGRNPQGAPSFTADGNFYNGLIMGSDGSVVRADGKPWEKDENGNDVIVSDYVMDDGSMEYWIILDSQGNKGSFLDKQVHVELTNLGTLAKASYYPDVEGSWSFDFQLTGSDKVRTADLDMPLGDTGVTVTHVEVSPISAYIEYESWTGIYHDLFSGEFPGLKMKDGTVYPLLWLEPGISGNVSMGNQCVSNFSFDRVIDPEQVEGIVFLKQSDDPNEAFSSMTDEEDYYLVPLEP